MLREAIDITHQKIIYPYLTSGKATKDREIAHERALWLMAFIQHPLGQKLTSKIFNFDNPRLKINVLGLEFKTPLGIAGGFDKNAVCVNAIATLGYSHADFGTITPLPQSGNPRPRVLYVPDLEAFANRMAFPSQGFNHVLQNILKHPPIPDFNLGLNFGANTKSSKRGTMIDDYLQMIQKLDNPELLNRIKGHVFVDLNISCHNIPGLVNLQEKETLSDLVSHADPLLKSLQIPWIVKISPDLSWPQVDDILNVIFGKAAGVVVSNGASHPLGALSGKPLGPRAFEISKYIYTQTAGKLPIIRSGGVMTAKDYWEAIFYGGASLVEVYSAFVAPKTSTPNLAFYFNKYLLNQLRAKEFKNVGEARGCGLF